VSLPAVSLPAESLPTESTTVSYPTGATTGTGTVLHIKPSVRRDGIDGELCAVILDVTPCHPVDAGWPDQPADRATLEWNGGEATVRDCVVAATDGTKLYLGADIPVRKGTEGWVFVVAHLVTAAPPKGIVVTVRVDEKYRRALSLGHTACHIASLALNAALSDRWSKTVGTDALGAPNFDAEARDVSRILERGSRDTYRLGKSLRKKGFRTEGLGEVLDVIEASVNASLAGWIAEKAAVSIDRDGDRLTDLRSWVCDLSDGKARIPCGGTHAGNLSELRDVRARLALEDVGGTSILVMETSVD
jgi:alanyl-tRNA synthetase